MKTPATGGGAQWYNGMGFVDAEVGGATTDFGLALVGSKAAFGVGKADTTITSNVSINDGAWHHVVATRINSTGAMKLYVDGQLEATATGPTALRNAPGGLRVGSTLFGGDYFTGAIDELQIFNYSLNSAQVAALASTVPAPWTAIDVGNPGSDGYSGYTPTGGGQFTVVAGGTDIGGTSDQFHFLSAPQGGDQSAVVRVNSDPMNVSGAVMTNAKAGLMFRNSAVANAAFVQAVYDQASGLHLVARDTAGASATPVGSGVPISAPFWLKLARAGNTFTASYATTTETHEAKVPMSSLDSGQGFLRLKVQR